MKAPAKLGLYALGLVVVFGTVYGIASVAIPDSAVADRMSAAETEGEHAGMDMSGDAEGAAAAVTRGVSLSVGEFRLGEVLAPEALGEEGELSFSIFDDHGDAVLDYTESHEKELHLIVVRSDGSQFRHVHPTLDADGVWSLPWSWAAPGTYRVFADFVPDGEEDPITLTRTVEVAGDFEPVSTEAEVREAHVDGYDVQLEGDLLVESGSTLTLSVTRDGEDVTTLEPYLGAFGHLVALRDGDLAYLHVHPEGAEPKAGQTSGPDIEFATEAPTPGRYLLYFDFQVDGEVRTAAFVVEASESDAPAEGGSHDDSDEDSH